MISVTFKCNPNLATLSENNPAMSIKRTNSLLFFLPLCVCVYELIIIMKTSHQVWKRRPEKQEGNVAVFSGSVEVHCNHKSCFTGRVMLSVAEVPPWVEWVIFNPPGVRVFG